MSDKVLEKEMIRINNELTEGMTHYKNTIFYMIGDAPISSLCLSKSTENILINDGCLRVYDLFSRDLTKIKGLGVTRKRNLTSCLNQFLPMC